MRKAGFVVLCLAVFLLAAAAGFAWLYLTPRGALQPNGPEEVMQRLLDENDRDWWRSEYVRQAAPAVTEFEDGAQVAGLLYDAAAGDAPFSFRDGETADLNAEAVYLVSAGEADLFRVRLVYAAREWRLSGVEALDTLRGTTHAVSVLLPEDAVLTLNGKTVGEPYIAEEGILYDDMQPLELREDHYPTRTLCRVDGLYLAADVEAARPGGLTLLYSDGERWEYTVPDAAGYGFRITAPREAAVTVNGALLTAEELVDEQVYATDLNVPEALLPALPVTVTYAAGGLYTPPAPEARLPDGTALEAREEDGAVVFAAPASAALYDRCHERVESFLRNLIEYGAGHGWSGTLSAYVADGSEMLAYINNAIASLHWTANVNLTFQNVTSSDYIPLGDAAFLCRGRAEFTTKTAYQTREIVMEYEMLWLDRDGEWYLWDLAFL